MKVQAKMSFGGGCSEGLAGGILTGNNPVMEFWPHEVTETHSGDRRTGVADTVGHASI